ncbi:MAG: PhnD/SsuA/transferrin family substrate-binding protein, partial [Bdellovibrionaceae bacterium]|nr:PhnD/SsuA/transferrin family substrate-binding protein [Bdellovibrio sp.]
SKIKKINDLKQKRILFVDEKSTSGYLYPEVYLRKIKLPQSSFKSVEFSGNHAGSVEALENKKADVIAVFADDEKGTQGAWTRFGKIKSVKYKVLWVSEPIPNDPFVVRQAFYDRNPKLTHEIMYHMIEIQNESTPQSLLHEILGHGELMPATQKQYDPVREMSDAFEVKVKL